MIENQIKDIEYMKGHTRELFSIQMYAKIQLITIFISVQKLLSSNVKDANYFKVT